MPTIPVTSPLGYVGIFLLLSGLFLVSTGLNIVKIEKITVTPGKKTCGFGICLLALGIAFLLPEIISSFSPTPTLTPVVKMEVSPPRATQIPPSNTPVPPIDTSTPEPPTNTPTIKPTDTPIPTLAKADELFTPAVVSVSPEQAIKDYYLAINNRQYEVTWTRLSNHFKDKFNCCTQDGHYDFNGYIQWWDSVAWVNIGEVSCLEQSGNTAKVFAQLSYVMKRGDTIQDYKPYIQLVFDATTHTWLFYDKGSTP